MHDLFLVRHGETESSRSGRHTDWTDVPLTEHGRDEAHRLVPLIRSHRIGAASVSPLQRARETAELIGIHDARVDTDLREWDYGGCEGVPPWRSGGPGPTGSCSRTGRTGPARAPGRDPGAGR